MKSTAVVLVHGVRTSSTMWRQQVKALEALGRRTVAIDLPGHGSRMDEPVSLTGSLDRIGEAVTGLGGPVLLVGFSLGGYLAIEYTSRYQDTLAGLAAASCCTVPRGVGTSIYAGSARVLTKAEPLARGFNRALESIALSPTAREDIEAGGLAFDSMVESVQMVSRTDPLISLQHITLPVWLINGAFDHFRLQERRFLRAARHGSLVVVPRANHMVAVTAPEAFTRIVERAARRLDAQT